MQTNGVPSPRPAPRPDVMNQGLAILGSTGSIGVQTLEVAECLGDQVRVVALAANSNVEALASQVRRFRPLAVALRDPAAAGRLRQEVGSLDVAVWEGDEGMERVATHPEAQLVVSAMVGAAGLLPTLSAIRAGKHVALANKETLVAAGAIVTGEAARAGVRLLPVDSEHSALFQCLVGEPVGAVERLILTASGGALRHLSPAQLSKVTVADVLAHPTWNMGDKLTVDCATLMNKGLEILEAQWLFGIALDRISVVIHHQSIVHSLVEFVDGSAKAQLSPPDMRLPIQYALTYPGRAPADWPRLDLAGVGSLTFEEPDFARFPCLELALDAGRRGGTAPAVLSAADEVAVQAFLEGRLAFTEIPRILHQTLTAHTVADSPELAEILEADAWARALAASLKE